MSFAYEHARAVAMYPAKHMTTDMFGKKKSCHLLIKHTRGSCHVRCKNTWQLAAYVWERRRRVGEMENTHTPALVRD